MKKLEKSKLTNTQGGVITFAVVFGYSFIAGFWIGGSIWGLRKFKD